MRLTKATFAAIKFACLNYHYAKCVPVNPLGYNVYNDKDEWCGVVLYSYGATTHIGTPYNLQQGQILELVRVALNGKQEHTSQCVAASLKQLKKDCPMLRLVVSYADCDQQHLGTIYQATNWIYEGLFTHQRYFVVNGVKMHPKSIYSHIIVENGQKKRCPQTLEYVRRYIDKNATEIKSLGKHKYLMPMDKSMKKKIMPLSKPYPKNEDWVKIDRAQFKNQQQQQ